MSDNLLLDVLGVLIGFAGVMLVLSLIVTALVQATIQATRLRADNLQLGLKSLLQKVFEKPEGVKPDALADDVISSCQLLPSSRGPTWILLEELQQILRDMGPGKGIDDAHIKNVTNRFPRMEGELKQRYLRFVRGVTIGWAILVAAYFQVSTPSLLRRLATDPEFREQAERAAEGQLEEYKKLSAKLLTYEDVSDRVLETLGRKHKEDEPLVRLLEEASGIGAGRTDIVTELKLVLAKRPDRDDIVREYESLLDKEYREAYGQALVVADVAVSRLALFDITPWREGVQFYTERSNIVGVIITAIFISFGAPFWFNALKQLVNLRDALAPKDEGKKEKEHPAQ